VIDFHCVESLSGVCKSSVRVLDLRGSFHYFKHTHTIMPRKSATVKIVTGVKAPDFKPPVKKQRKLSKAQAAKLAAVKDNADYDDGQIDDAAPAPVFVQGETMTDDALAAKLLDARDAGYGEAKKESTDRLAILKKKLAVSKEECAVSKEECGVADKKIKELEGQIVTLKETKKKFKEALMQIRETFHIPKEDGTVPFIVQFRKDHLWALSELNQALQKSDKKHAEDAAFDSKDIVREVVTSESVPVVDDTDSAGSSSGK